MSIVSDKEWYELPNVAAGPKLVEEWEAEAYAQEERAQGERRPNG